MDLFIVYAFIAGAGLSLMAGVLGCFVVWNRMAYFGDSIAHSALLGIALGLQLNAPLTLTTLAVCLCFAAALILLQQWGALASDTILGILAHSMLACGMLALSVGNAAAVDLHSFLFGDILTVTTADLAWLGGAAALVLAALARFWQPLLLLTISPDIAAAEEPRARHLRALVIVLMTATVAVSIQILGVLLITALFIIPAAAARLLAKSPEGMALLAVLCGIVSTAVGLWLSLAADVPSAPAIVAAAAACFALAAAGKLLLKTE